MSSDDQYIPTKGQSDSELDSESSTEIEPTRPNRWTGPKSTWRAITREERGLATSLTTLRDRDLSIHLYNAHALKRKAREVERDSKSGNKPQIPPQEDTKGFVPPNSWTAWPLPSKDVPRPGDKIGPDDDDDKYTMRRREEAWPSAELEEILIATTLGIAKRRFQKRKAEEEPEAGQEVDIHDEDAEMEDAASEGQELKSDSDDYGTPPPGQQATDDDSDVDSVHGKPSSGPGVQKSIEAPRVEIYKPVVSTDDDRSRELLRPSVRHTLSKLDDVLLALHHARKTCRRYSRSDGLSEDKVLVMKASGPENPSGHDPSTTESRARQPQKDTNISVEEDDPRLPDQPPSKRSKLPQGRPRKVHERLDGESQYDYATRLARIRKKPLPVFEPPLAPSGSPSPQPRSLSKSSTASRPTEKGPNRKRDRGLGLRDWSEVLGAAAIAGFDPAAVERATRRCAALFGEGMTMRTTVETPFSEPFDAYKTYEPEIIPDFDEDSIDNSDTSEVRRKPDHTPTEADPQIITRTSKIQNFFCSVAECPRKLQGFRDEYSLKRHMKNIHHFSEADLEERVALLEDEMEGAVHVDGFLRPLHPLKYSKRMPSMKSGKATSKPEGRKRDMSEEEDLDESSNEDYRDDSIGRRRGRASTSSS